MSKVRTKLIQALKRISVQVEQRTMVWIQREGVIPAQEGATAQLILGHLDKKWGLRGKGERYRQRHEVVKNTATRYSNAGIGRETQGHVLAC